MNDDNDAELIQQYLSGNRSSFSTLYQRYRGMTYNYIYQLIRNPSTAEDLYQTTWMKAVDALPNYKPQQKFASWICKIAHNVYIDHNRRQQRQKRRLEVEMPVKETGENAVEAVHGESPADSLEKSEIMKKIQQLVASLSPQRQEVFLLRTLGDLSFKDIADIQHCPVNTALGRMHQAVLYIRKNLHK